MNHIGLICSLLGILCVIVPVSGIMGSIIVERFQVAWMIFAAVMALVPVGLLVSFWIIKHRKKPVSAWFDEKQSFDAAVSAFVSLVTTASILVVFIVLSVFADSLPAPFWLLLLFFAGLSAFTGTMLARNRVSA